jgi:solute carrier family 25 aspartate/glutamate transporter 12/13
VFLLAFWSVEQHTTTAMLVPDPIVHFSTGAVAGGMGAVAAYPFDYIKSQMQTELGSSKFKSGWHAFCFTVKENPLLLYKGVGVQVLGIAPEKGIKLGVNDVLHTSFVTSMGVFPIWAQIVSGGVAGACQVVASSPLEVLKVGLQTSDMTFPQVWNQVGGFKGLFRGAEACILRDVLFTAVCFPLYAAGVDSSMNSKLFWWHAGMKNGLALIMYVVILQLLQQVPFQEL